MKKWQKILISVFFLLALALIPASILFASGSLKGQGITAMASEGNGKDSRKSPENDENLPEELRIKIAERKRAISDMRLRKDMHTWTDSISHEDLISMADSGAFGNKASARILLGDRYPDLYREYVRRYAETAGRNAVGAGIETGENAERMAEERAKEKSLSESISNAPSYSGSSSSSGNSSANNSSSDGSSNASEGPAPSKNISNENVSLHRIGIRDFLTYSQYEMYSSDTYASYVNFLKANEDDSRFIFGSREEADTCLKVLRYLTGENGADSCHFSTDNLSADECYEKFLKAKDKCDTGQGYSCKEGFVVFCKSNNAVKNAMNRAYFDYGNLSDEYEIIFQWVVGAGIYSGMDKMSAYYRIENTICQKLSYGSTNGWMNAVYTRVGECSVYSMMTQMMCQMCGIQCYLVDGNGGSHEWNRLVIDGQSYYTDLTWADNGSSANPKWSLSTSQLPDHSGSSEWSFAGQKIFYK